MPNCTVQEEGGRVRSDVGGKKRAGWANGGNRPLGLLGKNQRFLTARQPNSRKKGLK